MRALIAPCVYCRRPRVRFTDVLTDNGACYKSDVFAKACCQLELRRKRTRPYRPRANGKDERWIQTALHEWAHARTYNNADQRAAYLAFWLHDYNWHQPHASLHH